MTWQRKLGLIGVVWTASLIVAGAFQKSSINLDISSFADTFNIPREIVMLIISILLIQKDRLTKYRVGLYFYRGNTRLSAGGCYCSPHSDGINSWEWE